MLNEEQSAAVTSPAPKLIIVAGPGSGKSRVIVERAKHLKANGVDPSAMAFVTFTNVATAVMRKRLEEDVGPVGFVGTLHSMMFRLLRMSDPRWTMIGDEDAMGFLHRHAKLLSVRVSEKELLKARAKPDGGRFISSADRAVRSYRGFMRENRMLEYDMVLTEGLSLLKGGFAFPWSMLSVDEFQDSSAVDARIYRATRAPFMTVVADPDQSIYAFRGARPMNVLDFWNDTEFTRFKLLKNYRCAIDICATADAVIGENPDRVAKLIEPVSTINGLIDCRMFGADTEEAASISKSIKEDIESGVAPNQVAVLCRTNSLVFDMVKALKAAGIEVAEVERESVPRDWRLLRLIVAMIVSPGNWPNAILLAREQARIKKQGPDTAEAELTARRGAKPPAELFSLPSIQSILAMNANFARFGISKGTHKYLAGRIRLYDPTDGESLLECMREIPPAKFLNGVNVMTVHAAKGAEWESVYVPGVELFKSSTDMAEERRLFFVAVTRAKRRLSFTTATRRTVVYGGKQHLVENRQCEIFLSAQSAQPALA